MSNLSVNEVITKFDISRATLYRMIDEGLPYIVVGSRKKVFDADTVEAFIEKRRNAVVSKIVLGQEYTNAEISEIFKANLQRGMKKSNTANALVLLAKHESDNLYDDYWDENGVFYYTGMGFEGDQGLDFYENKTLNESNVNGVTVYLFEKFEGHEFVYRGIVKLIGSPFQQEENDTKGQVRKVWKFPLKLVGEGFTLSEEILKEHHEKTAKSIKNKRLSLKELKEKSEIVSKYCKSSTRKVVSSTYERNEYVRLYSLARAKGRCELCLQPAPFLVAGEPYLESHHIRWLSRGGEDTNENVSAVCPNCHRRLHVLDNASDIEQLKNNVKNDEEKLQRDGLV